MFRVEVEYKRNHKETLPSDWSTQIEKFQDRTGSKRLKFERPVPERCLIMPWTEKSETAVQQPQQQLQQPMQQQQQLPQQPMRQQQQHFPTKPGERILSKVILKFKFLN